MSTFFAVYANLFQFIFQHSRSARFLPIILSIIKAIAPSPVTIQRQEKANKPQTGKQRLAAQEQKGKS